MCLGLPLCGLGDYLMANDYPPRDVFRDSLKSLEADLQHANTLLAGDMLRDFDGAYLQVRLAVSPLAPFLLFLVRWADCSIAGALGLLHVCIYKLHNSGRLSHTSPERRAALRDFHEFLYPSLLQLQPGITDLEFAKQQRSCWDKYLRQRYDSACLLASSSADSADAPSSPVERERARECGICLEERRPLVGDQSERVALPTCGHSMCRRCYADWSARSTSCPFCREQICEEDQELWVVVSEDDAEDIRQITKENLHRLVCFIQRLPVVFSDHLLTDYETTMFI